MAVSIFARIHRGRLHFQVADVLFSTFAQAATAWSAAESHRLDVAEPQPTPRVRTWTAAELQVALEFFGAPRLVDSYTGLLAELRQEIHRRQGGVA